MAFKEVASNEIQYNAIPAGGHVCGYSCPDCYLPARYRDHESQYPGNCFRRNLFDLPQWKKEDRSGWRLGVDVIGGLALFFLLIWLFKDYECTDPFVDPSRYDWWLASILMIANLRMGILARKSEKNPDTLTQ